MLEIRLPLGLRDYLPASTAERRAVADMLVGTFERWGYSRVLLPPFEYQEVLAQGLGATARAASFLFVEPGSGRVVALPPDATPQLARMAATRMAAVDGPLRLCYQARLVRQDGAQGSRELFQAGVELYGMDAADGDAEVIALSAEALVAAGLDDVTLDLGHPHFLKTALEGLAPRVAEEMQGLIARKDAQGVAELCRKVGAQGRTLCLALAELHGEPRAVLARLERETDGQAHALAVGQLRSTVRRLGERTGARVTVDLGEVRGLDYYTGVSFAAYLPGAPDCVASGGRYDDLVARYGRRLHATGFAIDVDRVAEVRASRGLSPPAPPRGVELWGPAEQVLPLARTLRERGVRVPQPTGPLERPPAVQLAYATSVGLAAVVIIQPDRVTLHTARGDDQAPPGTDLATWITSMLGSV